MMRGALLLFLLLGGLLLGGVAWLAMTPPEAPAVAQAPAPAPRGAYLVAARAVRAGVLLRAEDLRAAEMEVAQAPAGALAESPAARGELLGGMVRRALQPGEAIRPGDVLRPGERGFLAAILAPDMRAFSVSVDVVTGAAGLIWPGDRVDLLLTQQVNDEAVPLYRRLSGETVLTDVRVIAVDQAIMQGAVGDGPDATRSQGRTVTLELGARQAEVAAVASRLGRLSLLLRSAADAAPDAVAAPLPAPAPASTQAGRDGALVRTLADGAQGRARSDGLPRAPAAAEPRPTEPGVVWGGDVSPGLRQGRPDSTPPRSVRVFLGGTRQEEFRY